MKPLHEQMALARHLYNTDHSERTLEVLAAMPAEASDLEGYWGLKARALEDLDRDAEAMEATQQGLARAPESVGLLCILGDLHRRADRAVEAERAYLAALQRDPELISALLGYARVVAEVGQQEKAHALVERAAQLDPERTEVWYVRYELANLAGDDALASKIAAEIARREPDSPHSLALLGVDAASRGQMRDGRGLVERAAQADVRVVESLGADHVRLMHMLSHPLAWPLWPVFRFNSVAIVVVALAVIGFTQWFTPKPVADAVGTVLMAWAIYVVVGAVVLSRRVS